MFGTDLFAKRVFSEDAFEASGTLEILLRQIGLTHPLVHAAQRVSRDFRVRIARKSIHELRERIERRRRIATFGTRDVTDGRKLGSTSRGDDRTVDSTWTLSQQ